GEIAMGTALRVRQADDQGRYGFVEAQADGRWRALDGGAVHRMGLDQRRMGKGVPALAQDREGQPEKCKDEAHRRLAGAACKDAPAPSSVGSLGRQELQARGRISVVVRA